MQGIQSPYSYAAWMAAFGMDTDRCIYFEGRSGLLYLKWLIRVRQTALQEKVHVRGCLTLSTHRLSLNSSVSPRDSRENPHPERKIKNNASMFSLNQVVESNHKMSRRRVEWGRRVGVGMLVDCLELGKCWRSGSWWIVMKSPLSKKRKSSPSRTIKKQNLHSTCFLSSKKAIENVNEESADKPADKEQIHK